MSSTTNQPPNKATTMIIEGGIRSVIAEESKYGPIYTTEFARRHGLQDQSVRNTLNRMTKEGRLIRRVEPNRGNNQARSYFINPAYSAIDDVDDFAPLHPPVDVTKVLAKQPTSVFDLARTV